MQFPNTVNGYPVIRECPTPAGFGTRAGRVILVDRGESFHRYVTAWQGVDSTGRIDDGWHIGHYISDYAEAVADFEERAKRGV